MTKFNEPTRQIIESPEESISEILNESNDQHRMNKRVLRYMLDLLDGDDVTPSSHYLLVRKKIKIKTTTKSQSIRKS
jgi:hypothetical protein